MDKSKEMGKYRETKSENKLGNYIFWGAKDFEISISKRKKKKNRTNKKFLQLRYLLLILMKSDDGNKFSIKEQIFWI